jgi:hypothetical protein
MYHVCIIFGPGMGSQTISIDAPKLDLCSGHVRLPGLRFTLRNKKIMSNGIRNHFSIEFQ